jgi:zinc transport system permease protein
MLDDFMTRAALAGVGVSIAAAPLGCFIVWRRMAYFGEATAHAAVLGVALALAFQVSVFGGAVAVALLVATLVTLMEGRSFAMDTLLGVAAHTSLATGLIIVTFVSGVRIDLMAYLFGDILAVSRLDLITIWSGVGIILGLITWRWSPLLISTLNEDLASAAGFYPEREKLILTISLAIIVAIGIKVVGVLLIISMLIIPPAAARLMSKTPEVMAVIAAFIGAISALIGLYASYIFDTPTGPSIVVTASLFFFSFFTGSIVLGSLARKLKNHFF